MKKLLSAVIVAHNEENHLEECLKSISFADEIVVVLDKCTDNSKKIALEYTKNIVEGSWNIEGERRNIGLKNCNGEWILELDADERVSRELSEEILQSIKSSHPCSFIVPIANYIGKRYVKYGWLRSICVSERQTIHYNGYKTYHEDKEIHPTADLNGEIKYLKTPISHFVDKDVADMINRFNRYTTWRSRDMVLQNKIKFKYFSFFTRFFKAFIVKKGYKEGVFGLLTAILAAIYPLVSYLKAKNISNLN
ncbi:MAG: glycosyltransferase involved in cell wall biosynthesis [Lentimonas sp.]|jgi:glycosyltransferase involved in cell wall biosynthesis